jgi:hypothetical protein
MLFRGVIPGYGDKIQRHTVWVNTCFLMLQQVVQTVTCKVPTALTQSTLDVFRDISVILHQTYGTRDSFPLLLNTLEEELCPHTQP